MSECNIRWFWNFDIGYHGDKDQRRRPRLTEFPVSRGPFARSIPFLDICLWGSWTLVVQLQHTETLFSCSFRTSRVPVVTLPRAYRGGVSVELSPQVPEARNVLAFASSSNASMLRYRLYPQKSRT